MHSVALRTVSLAPGQELGPLRARDVVRLLRDALPAREWTTDDLVEDVVD